MEECTVFLLYVTKASLESTFVREHEIPFAQELGKPIVVCFLDESLSLDLGGGATAERIKEAVRIVLSKENIHTVFLCIFGGITRCDEVAGGVRMALEAAPEGKCAVIRMEGTNKEKGQEILAGLDMVVPVGSIPEGVAAIAERQGV